MAETIDALVPLAGRMYMQVTPERAQILIEALKIALSSDRLDKSVKGVITAHCQLLAEVASGHSVERNPARWVYIAKDVGPHGEVLTKIGHARDLDERFARMTDRPTPLKPWRAWLFDSVAVAMEREHSARQKYKDKAFHGGGGSEWVEVNAMKVLADLTAEWGEPNFVDE